ncbi:hypothetical protein [Thermococcus sp.]|uniref:hypothetical protein n=1 Tax=Thermococcus sp. TaxID=35749 RepID=UPI002618EE0B|nr:hypothetical protein [Thermococcus sp.]
MAVSEVWRHVPVEEAKKLAKKIYEDYMTEVDKKWEQFKKEMEGVPPEILYDQNVWDDWMVDRWVQLIDEIPAIEEEYEKQGIWVWIDHEEDVSVHLISSTFEVEVRNGELFVYPGGFREWKYADDLNAERRWAIRRAWEGFARLFFPEVLEENKWLYRWDVDSWLELEVYWDLTVKGAWKEGEENNPLVVMG